MTNYIEMKNKLASFEPFRGNSVSAYRTEKQIDGRAAWIYEVFSYSTLMYSTNDLGQVIFNNKYYSVTTSKLQNMLIDIYNLNDGNRKRS